MELKNVINEGIVCSDLKATTKDELFHEMAELLYEDSSVTDIDTFIADLYERESMENTVIGTEIATPHSKSDAVARTRIAIARKLEGIDYEDQNHTKVKLFFMFATPKSKSDEHLILFAKFAEMLCQEDFLNDLIKAKTDKDMLKCIFDCEAALQCS